MSRCILVMGVSGTGKSTLGGALATRLGGRFVDADDHHSAANVAKMSAGQGLTDDDRWPWLAQVAAVSQPRANETVVLACSALKASYRDRLRDTIPGLAVVFIDGDANTLHARLSARSDHFMPPSQVALQLQTLEVPTPNELLCAVGLDDPTSQQVRTIERALSR